jgi:cytochrome b involved in lipid metabolism
VYTTKNTKSNSTILAVGMRASTLVVEEAKELGTSSAVAEKRSNSPPLENLSHRSTTVQSSSNDRKSRLLSRSELISRIISGQNLVIYHSLVLDLTRWADKHPGGKLAVLHFVGRDASDEMDAYHSLNDLKKVNGFIVGRVDENEVSLFETPVPGRGANPKGHPDGCIAFPTDYTPHRFRFNQRSQFDHWMAKRRSEPTCGPSHRFWVNEQCLSSLDVGDGGYSANSCQRVCPFKSDHQPQRRARQEFRLSRASDQD